MQTFKEYEQFIGDFARYPSRGEANNEALAYCALGLCGEAGEYSEKIKKKIRDGTFDSTLAVKELGDVLWYLTRSANELGFSLQEVAEMNYNKLKDRAERNVLAGSGDTR